MNNNKLYKIKFSWFYVIQIILLILWFLGVIERSLINLIWVTAITWVPYILIGILKLVEIRLRKKIENKIKKDGNK